MTIKIPTLLVGTAAIGKAITSITKRGAKLDADIQHCALSILAHVDQHSNITLVNQLYLGMPKGSRKAALTEWLLAFGKCKANDGDDKKAVPFLFDGTRKTNLEGAVERPWFDFKPDVAPDASFDIYAAIMSALNKGDKAHTKGMEVKGLEFAHKIKAQLEEEMAAVEAAEKSTEQLPA